MRRWNGWGDETVAKSPPDDAKKMLESLVGLGKAPKDATLDDVVAMVPESRLPAHPLIEESPEGRVRHARGQSMADWIAMRTGRIDAFPDGVAYPATNGQVRELLTYAKDAGVHLIPYGGGTSVAGHINPVAGDNPVLTMDLSRLSSMRSLDATSQLATFGAGVTGPDLEAQLEERGFTLGHFPQSFELSTLGGWVVTRSSGQQSLHYGRIEGLFAGGRLETPVGTLSMPTFPGSAAGPDLREMIMGSEGRFGVLTEATVRISPLPEHEEFHAIFFPDWQRAIDAARAMVQARLPMSMMRLSTAVETATTLSLAGHPWVVGAIEKILALRGAGEEKCMLLVGVTGKRSLTRVVLREALGHAGEQGGVHVGQPMGRAWHKNRFKAPYLRDSLWEMGYAVDTLETATNWTGVTPLIEAIEEALAKGLEDIDERVHVFTHLSHLYPSGSNIYTTYLFRIADEPEETQRRWEALKGAASKAITDHGGTITHQHGVGIDHKPYLKAEKGELGVGAIETLRDTFDPSGMMNPGKLVD